MQGIRDTLAGMREGNSNVLIADGATGTMLQSLGLPAGVAPERWNVERPDAIRAHHRAYLDVGSQIILTNTFGGSRIKLARMEEGLDARAEELNRAAAVLAKAEAGVQAYVAGDIGPSGELLAPYGLLSYEEAVCAFAQQAGALIAGGVDLLWVETMSDLNEARAAIEGVQQALGRASVDLPVFCSLSFNRGGRTMMGVSPAQAVEMLWPMGLAAIGANCGEGIEPVKTALAGMRDAFAALGESVLPPLIAKPNAGLPRLEDGETVFDMGPGDLAAHGPEFVELGARIVGACCGSMPAHIAALAAALR
jgi:methionine synthase I (cobalamin-dependent)